MDDKTRLQQLIDERERRQLAAQAPAPVDDKQARLQALVDERERRQLAPAPVAVTPPPPPPEEINTDPDFSFLDMALPVAGGALGGVAGAALGPFGVAGGAAGGSALGQAAADLLGGDGIDPGAMLITGILGGLLPGAGGVAKSAVPAAGRLVKEFAPDVVGAMGGASLGGSLVPGMGALPGAAVGARAVANQFGRSGTIRTRAKTAAFGKKRGSAPTTAASRNPADVASNAEREARLRRELLGIAE